MWVMTKPISSMCPASSTFGASGASFFGLTRANELPTTSCVTSSANVDGFFSPYPSRG